MGKKDDKTNVMRLLDQKKVSYTPYNYTQLGLTNGAEIAKALKEDPKRVFKTWLPYSFCFLRLEARPCCPGGKLRFSKYLSAPKMGSPNLRAILVLGPVYLAIVILI